MVKIIFKKDGYYLITWELDKNKPKDYIKIFKEIVSDMLIENNSLNQDLPLIVDGKVKGALIPCKSEKFAHELLKPSFEKYSNKYSDHCKWTIEPNFYGDEWMILIREDGTKFDKIVERLENKQKDIKKTVINLIEINGGKSVEYLSKPVFERKFILDVWRKHFDIDEIKDQSVKSPNTAIYRIKDAILELKVDIESEEGNEIFQKYLYYIEDETYNELVKNLRVKIEKKLKDKFEISLEKKEYKESKLKKKLKSLSEEYKERVYIDRRPDAIVVFYIENKIAGQKVKEEIEEFLGVVVETIHKSYPYNVNEKDLFITVRNQIEDVLEEMSQKCREVKIYKESMDELIIQLQYRGSKKEIKEAEKCFQDFNEEQAKRIKKIKEKKIKQAAMKAEEREEEK